MNNERRRFSPDMVSVVLLNNFEIKMFITVKYWCNEEYWPRWNIEPGAYFNLEKWDQKPNSYPGSSSTASIFFEPIMTFTRWKMSLLEINFIYRQSFELCLITGTCCTRFKLSNTFSGVCYKDGFGHFWSTRYNNFIKRNF